MKLYEIADDLSEILDNLSGIFAWEPDTDADGNPMDMNGNPIDDIEAYRDMLVTAWCETYDAVEVDFKEKAQNIALYALELDGDVDFLKAEIKRLQRMQRAKEKSRRFFAEYIMSRMEQLGMTKLETPLARLTVRNNAESVLISDERRLIEWAQNTNHDDILKYSDPEIRKTAVKNLIKSGIEIPEAQLTRTKSLLIK